RRGQGSAHLRGSTLRASVDGADSGVVEIVDPSGGTVLSGDTEVGVMQGGAWFDGVDGHYGDVALVDLWSYPAYDESISFMFVPSEPGASPVARYLRLSTAEGDRLPVGASRVGRLSGRAFEVRTSDGEVLVVGTVPMLEDMGQFQAELTAAEAADDGSIRY